MALPVRLVSVFQNDKFVKNFKIMSKKNKALVFNMLGFLVLFMLFRFIVAKYTNFTSWQIPVSAGLVASILAPKFQSIKTAEGEKLFMKWLFVKGVKEIK